MTEYYISIMIATAIGMYASNRFTTTYDRQGSIAAYEVLFPYVWGYGFVWLISLVF